MTAVAERKKDRRANKTERLALDKLRRVKIVTYEQLGEYLGIPMTSVREVMKGRVGKYNTMLSDLRRFRDAIDTIAAHRQAAKP